MINVKQKKKKKRKKYQVIFDTRNKVNLNPLECDLT